MEWAPKRIEIDADNNTVTINIRNMNKDGYVELTYKKMWASDETEDAENLFSVTVASDSDAPTAPAPAANAAKGAILERPGSGTIEVSDTAVEVKTAKDFTITYTAATRIEDAYFVVQIPPKAFEMPNTDDDTRLVPLTLTDPTHPAPGTFGQATNDGDTDDVDETRPHPNGDITSSRYGRVEKVSVSKVVRGKGGLNDVRQTLIPITVQRIITLLFGVHCFLKAGAHSKDE